MTAGKTRRGGETGQLDKIKTAVKVEKKRARAQASVEKKLRAVKKPASAPDATATALPLPPRQRLAFPASRPSIPRWPRSRRASRNWRPTPTRQSPISSASPIIWRGSSSRAARRWRRP